MGATINIMLAASMAEGLTVIENVAKEPHIVDVANFLNSMGANIWAPAPTSSRSGACPSSGAAPTSIIPDQIEAGTYMAAVAACGGEVKICNIIPKHMDCISPRCARWGWTFRRWTTAFWSAAIGPLIRTNIKALPYPGFPTDMQPQMAAALCLAQGTSIITDSVWSSRFRYTDEFKRMGPRSRWTGTWPSLRAWTV